MDEIIIMAQAHRNLPQWQQPVENTENLLTQIRRVTRELQALTAELNREWGQEGGSTVRILSNASGCSAAEDLNQLKAASDQVRRLLWLNLETGADQSGHTSDHHGSQSRQHALQEQFSLSKMEALPTSAEAGSFFERLHFAIDGYMQERGIAPRGKLRRS